MSQYGGENNPHFRPRQRPDPTTPQHIQPGPLQPWDYHPTQIPQSDWIHPRPQLQTQTTIPVTRPPMSSPEHDHREPPPPMVHLRPSEHHTRPQPPTPPRQHRSGRHSRPVDTPPVLQPTRHSRPVDPSIPQSTRHSRPEDAQPVQLPNRHARPIDPPPGRHSARHSRLADAHVPQEHQQGPKPLRQSGPHGRQHENLMYPEPGRTKPITWCGAVFCVILWLVIILGGLLVLIVYLVYRPRTPHFEISNASLNAVYLDTGYLLNADLRVLVNFTNPNKKVHVDFSYVILQLYFEKQLIANQYIEPFSASSAENKLADVEIVSSQVRLPIAVRQKLVAQMQRNRITFEVDGIFHARSNFGSLLRYSYWLYGHCKIEMTGPPSGIIISSKCYTKD